MTQRPRAAAALAHLVATCFALAAAASFARAAIEPPASPTSPPTSPPASAPAAPPEGLDDAERVKAELARAKSDLERRLKVLEEAQAMLQRGESLDAVRDFMKSKNMNIMARMLDDRRRGPAAGPGGLGVRDRSQRGGGGGGAGRRLFNDRDRDDDAPPPHPGEPRDGPPGPGPGPGGPGREGGREGRDRPPLVITVEERQIIRNMLVQLMPQRLAELDDITAKDPPEGERQFMKLVDSPRFRSLIELRRANPDAFRLRVEEFAAAAECNRRARAVVTLESEGAAPEKIEAERAALRAAAERLFDKRIEGLSKEVERLADKAASIRSELDEQNAHRADHITRSVEDAIERAKRPAGPPPGPPPGPDGRPPREGPPRDGERRPGGGSR